MAYGTVKVDNITFTNGGVDKTISVSGLFQSTSGDLTLTGTVSAPTIKGTTLVSGATVTGNIGQFTTLNAVSGTFTDNSTAAAFIPTGATVPINGLFLPSGNTIGLSSSGVERMRIDSFGRLLVGTTTARTNLYGTNYGYEPKHQIEYQSPFGVTNQPSISLMRNSNDTGPVYVLLGKSRGTTAGSDVILQNNDSLATLQFFGATGSGLFPAASITAYVDGTPTTNGVPGRIVFSTNTSGDSNTERMRINSKGQVAISLGDVNSGAPTPWPTPVSSGYPTPLTLQNYYYQCLVLSDSSADAGIQSRYGTIAGARRNPAHKAFTALAIADDGSSREVLIGGGPVGFSAPDPTLIRFATAPSYNETDDAGIERMRIDSSGRVLIGTTTAPSVGTSADSYLVVQSYPGDSTGDAIFSLQRGEFPSSGSALGEIRFNSSDGSTFAKIGAAADGTGGSNNYPGRLIFFTTSSGQSSPVERMRINSSGHVSINTTESLILGYDTKHVIAGDGDTNWGQAIITYGATNASAGLVFYKTRGTTPSSGVPPLSGDILGEFYFSGPVASGAISGGKPGARISAIAESNWTSTTNHTAGIRFYTAASGDSNPVERLQITHNGYLRMAANTGGIQFNGDTAATNALDDYEEGTWTPTIKGSTTAGTATYSYQYAQYRKIGKLVHVDGYLDWSSGTGTGDLLLGNLPFTTSSGGGNAYYTIGANVLSFASISTTPGDVVYATQDTSTSTADLYIYKTNGNSGNYVAYAASGNFGFSITYMTDS